MLFSLLSPLPLLSITFFDAKVEFVTLGGGKALASPRGSLPSPWLRDKLPRDASSGGP